VNLAHKLWYGLLVVAVLFLIATKFATPLYNNYIAHPALFHQAPGIHYAHPVGELSHETHIMPDQDDGYAHLCLQLL